ncbi:import receptor subunit tom22 [Anaeramoeba flamelloides]|uniref:Import receptor subunit tom22 n=1 Tax=Anaeramoeba flamelloides TaxID=1746091 RepID=A0AAV7Z2Y3_9EUKA|nr:import receptor subunit tom22 [Anaeramoeba flamelloides]KAJ6226184.1 import receptor subunit tom22 [Anaeramoeba flamelloides]
MSKLDIQNESVNNLGDDSEGFIPKVFSLTSDLFSSLSNVGKGAVGVAGKVLWIGVTGAAAVVLPYGVTLFTEMNLKERDKQEAQRLGVKLPFDSTNGTGFPPIFPEDN